MKVLLLPHQSFTCHTNLSSDKIQIAQKYALNKVIKQIFRTRSKPIKLNLEHISFSSIKVQPCRNMCGTSPSLGWGRGAKRPPDQFFQKLAPKTL